MRANPSPLASYPWQTQHDLRFADMDTLGHINNGAYGSLMETNRCRLFTSPDFAKQEGAVVVLVRFEIDYLREMHWPGDVVVASGIERVGGASFRLRQAIFQDGSCRAIAIATGAMMDATTRRAAPIGDPLRASLLRWAMLNGEADGRRS